MTVSAPQAPPYGLGRTRLPAWPERARDPSRLLLAPLPTMPLIARERPRRPRTRSMHALDRTAGPNDHEQPSASAPDLPLIARDGRDDHERPRRPSHDPDRAAPLGGRRGERLSSRRRAPSHSDAAAALLVTNRHKHGRGGILALISPARPPRAQPQLVTNRHDPSAGAREVGAPPSPTAQPRLYEARNASLSEPALLSPTRSAALPNPQAPPLPALERRPPQPPSPASANPSASLPESQPSFTSPAPGSRPRVATLLAPLPAPGRRRHPSSSLGRPALVTDRHQPERMTSAMASRRASPSTLVTIRHKRGGDRRGLPAPAGLSGEVRVASDQGSNVTPGRAA